MDIKTGKKYNCDLKGITAHVTKWDSDYGVWRGTVSGIRGNFSEMYWFKNGCKINGMRSDYDLKSEIREPRVFYVNEYSHVDGTKSIGRAVYEEDKQDLLNQGPYRAETKICKIIKLVEVLE